MSGPNRLLTIDDVLWDAKYERGELWDGHFVEQGPTGGPHGYVQACVSYALGMCPDLASQGRVLGGTAGFVVRRNPDRVLSPDSSFLSWGRCPRTPRMAFVEGAPDLAVEIRAPEESWLAVVEKGGVWIGHGADLVWCVDPHATTVLVMRPGREPEIRGADDTVRLTPISARRLPVREIFGDLL